MNNFDKLFVISTIMVPLILISLNYSTINEFYTYSTPLSAVVVWDNDKAPDIDKFKTVSEKPDSTCFATSNNYYCYEKPRFSDNSDVGISVVRSNTTGTIGELHAEPIDRGYSYFTMKNITRIDDNTALITFADRDLPMLEKSSTKEIDFEFSKIVEKFDTFVSDCIDDEDPRVTIIQYLGISTIDDKDYFITWHTGGKPAIPIVCDYPQIIQYSFGHDFGI